MAEIVLKDIHKYYGIQHVLRGISLEIYEGTKVGLIGRNGAGKQPVQNPTGEEPMTRVR